MKKILLHSENFYVFSYPPFSNIDNEAPDIFKQLNLQGYPEDAIIDINKIGKNVLGSVPSYNPHNNNVGEFNLSSFSSNGQINTIVEEILRARFAQGLPAILIGNFPSFSKVEKYMELAKEHGYNKDMFFLNIDNQIIHDNYKKSSHIYPLNYLNTFLEAYYLSLQKSKSTYEVNDTLIMQPSIILKKDLEVLGDVHGMLPHVILHLNKKGWIYNEDTMIFSHPDKNKALLFLGDIVDRHPDSIKMLKSVKATCEANFGYLLLGNHEAKLIHSYTNFLDNGIVRGRSLSSSQTFTSFLKLPHSERQELFNFLKSCPTSYSLLLNEHLEVVETLNEAKFKFGFVHADTTYFHPFKNSVSNSMYGATKDFAPLKEQSDLIYQKGFDNKLNDFILFRGHTYNQGEYPCVYSLDYDQAFDGAIASLNMLDYLASLKANNFIYHHDLFKQNTLLTETNYNFDNEFKKSLYGKVLQLLEKKLIVDGVYNSYSNPNKQPHKEGFQIFKYGKMVHFERLWDKEPLLEKTRGIVFDIGGQIIVHPFDKLYNYEEYNSGKHLTTNSKIRAVEKLNGFLGCITKHPYRNDLLFTTTGNLDNEFTGYIKSFVTPELKMRLLSFFASQGNQTLMFEVIHPEDPHIIQYETKDHGLWLIGARGLNENDKIKSEIELDKIANILSLRRPQHFTCNFGDLLKKLEKCEIEGYMVWEIKDDGSEQPIMKIKSDYYLVTKFLSRMTPKKTTTLYKDPKAFKQSIDEEYYSLTEHIVKTYPKDIFDKMSEIERVNMIQSFLHEQRKNKLSKKM